MPKAVFHSYLKSAEVLTLRQVDYGESSKIISFLTKDRGKRSGILHGIKKNKSHHLGKAEPLTQGTIFYTERSHSELIQVQRFESIFNFHSLYSQYQVIIFALYCAELIECCEFPEYESEQFFDLLFQTLHQFAKASSPQTIKTIFEWNLLQLLGILPNFSSCQCQQILSNVKVFQMDCASGTLQCPHCLSAYQKLIPISTEAIHALMQLPRTIDQNAYSQWDTLFSHYFQFHTRRLPKSRKLFNSLPSRS